MLVRSNANKLLVKAYEASTSKELRMTIDIDEAGLRGYSKPRCGKTILHNLAVVGATPDRYSLGTISEWGVAARQQAAKEEAKEHVEKARAQVEEHRKDVKRRRTYSKAPEKAKA